MIFLDFSISIKAARTRSFFVSNIRHLFAISLTKMHDMQVKTDSHIINVNISSNCNTFTSERKFDKGITVQALKDKLELITGARSGLMKIEVFDANDSKVCDLKV